MSSVSLRPYVPADAKRCAEIFRASIEELAAEDYDADQREAWASTADDEATFADRVGGGLGLIAVIDGAAAGFRQPQRRGDDRHALRRSRLRGPGGGAGPG